MNISVQHCWVILEKIGRNQKTFCASPYCMGQLNSETTVCVNEKYNIDLHAICKHILSYTDLSLK